MELKNFLSTLRKHAFAVIAITVILIILGAGLSLVLKPTYKAKAVCLVKSTISFGDYRDVNLAGEIINKVLPTLGSAITSDRILQEIAAKLDNTRSISTLRKAITAEPVEDSDVLEISTTDEDPETSVRMARAAAEAISFFVSQDNAEIGLQCKVELLSLSTDPTKMATAKPVRDGILGGILGLLLGMGLAGLLEYLDTSVKTKDELEELLQKPVLAEIPLVSARTPDNRGDRGRKDLGTLEAVKTLRANLLCLDSSESLKTILVTSPNAREGRSFVSDQLARAFAASGKRVALVDADLRKAGRAREEEARAEAGLSDVLAGRLPLDEVLHDGEPGNLKYLSSGATLPNPSEMLASPVMHDVLNQLEQDHELVILDSSPLGLFADALVLAALVDGVIMVVEAGSTSRASVEAADGLLSKPNITVVGAVLNKIKKPLHWLKRRTD